MLQARDVKIFADAHVKHGAHAIVQDRPIAELVRDVEFFNADVVIFTGQRTGHAADFDYLRKIRAAASLPTLVGSGVDSGNVNDILSIVDGVIVASALKVDGCWWNPVDDERARQFVERARKSAVNDTSSFSERMRAQASSKHGTQFSATVSFARLRPTPSTIASSSGT